MTQQATSWAARAGEADGAQRLAQALVKEEDGTVRAEMIKGLVLLSGKGPEADPQVHLPTCPE